MSGKYVNTYKDTYRWRYFMPLCDWFSMFDDSSFQMLAFSWFLVAHKAAPEIQAASGVTAKSLKTKLKRHWKERPFERRCAILVQFASKHAWDAPRPSPSPYRFLTHLSCSSKKPCPCPVPDLPPTRGPPIPCPPARCTNVHACHLYTYIYIYIYIYK